MKAATQKDLLTVEEGRKVFAELQVLRNEVGAKHFLRLQKADSLLKNHAWVEDPSGGGGDESKALDRLETDCFGDLCGFLQLPELLEVFHFFPKLKDWEAEKFSFSRMHAKYRASRPKKPVLPRSRSSEDEEDSRGRLPDPSQFMEMPPGQKDKVYIQAFRQKESLQERLAKVTRERDKYREENKNLKEETRKMQALISKLRKDARILFAEVG